ncbi:MAG: hypothetical protein HC817_09875, partial [Saprospiraceae bacterium]|nr:hypothetical protein [Saprospiraceae bacterium]
MGYSEGWHTLKVRVTTINGKEDENNTNNYLTKRFYYQPNGCADNSENGNNEFAFNITPNNTVKGMISSSSNFDKFTFTTTDVEPILRISLITPKNYNYNFTLTDASGRYYSPSYESTNNPNERIYTFPVEVGKKWFITVGGSYNSYFTNADCYSLTVKTIPVKPDLAIISMKYPIDTVISDAFISLLQLRNDGNAIVSQIDFDYQIDSLPIQTISWSNTISFGQNDFYPQRLFDIPLGKIKGYTEGLHTLRVKVKSINNLADIDSTDNVITRKFYYKNTGCFDNYEPNDTITKAGLIPMDSLVQSFLSENDIDIFKFYTTAERPNFKLTFRNARWNNPYITLLDRNGNVIYDISLTNDYNLNETYYTFKGSKADTFYFRIIYYQRYYTDYTTQGCYSINIKSEGRFDAARITAISTPKNEIITSSFTPDITIRHTGNTIFKTILFETQIDSLPIDTFLWTLTSNYSPDANGAYPVTLKKMMGYTEGVHFLNIRAKEINGYANQDTQKVFSKRFIYTKTGCDDNYEPNETIETAYPDENVIRLII